MRFRDKLMSFMYGRYGIDTLYYVMLGVFLALTVARLFVGNIAGIVLYILETLVFVLIFYRMFSRNIYRRRRENEAFLKVFKKIRQFFSHIGTRIRDRKKYRYRKCPECRANLRLPTGTGRHTVVCPKCKNRFEVNIRF